MTIRWSPEAYDNLAEIELYLRLQRSPFTAFTIDYVYQEISSLVQMPFRGRPGRILSTRELVFTKVPYVVVYRIRDDVLEIVSIRDTSRQPINQ